MQRFSSYTLSLTVYCIPVSQLISREVSSQRGIDMALYLHMANKQLFTAAQLIIQIHVFLRHAASEATSSSKLIFWSRSKRETPNNGF